MNLNLKINDTEYPVFGFSMSVLLHALIISAAVLLLNSSLSERKTGSPYVQIKTIEAAPTLNNEQPQTEKKDITENMDKTQTQQASEKVIPEKKEVEENQSSAQFLDFSDTSADTSELVQVYSENTLDVRLKYPSGWTYLDQNVKSKLDGITFWAGSTNYNPPPYVHIEVKDKDLFNPKRFAHSYKTRNYTAFYNDPEELAGQFTQIIYIRTDTNEDFSLKLIMKGEEAFKSFQPVFFGMVKSFKYGNQFF